MTLASGKVNGEISYFGDDQPAQSSLSKLLIELAPLNHCRLAGDDRISVLFGHLLELFQVHADDEHLVVRMLGQQLVQHLEFARVLSGDPVLLPRLGQGIVHP